MSEHALIVVSSPEGKDLTQYILTDVSRTRLKDGMLGSQLAWGLDIENADQVEELFSIGRTETTGLAGLHHIVTLKWCACTDPTSHKRDDAAQLGL